MRSVFGSFSTKYVRVQLDHFVTSVIHSAIKQRIQESFAIGQSSFIYGIIVQGFFDHLTL